MLQRFIAIAGQHDGTSEFFELTLENQLIDDVVFGDQHAQVKLSHLLRLCVFIACGSPQSLGLADSLVNSIQVVEIHAPDTVFMPGFAAAIAADQDPWTWPVRLQVLLDAAWVQLK